MGDYKVNGKKLLITPADFKTCIDLKNAVIRAVNKGQLSIGEEELKSLSAGDRGEVSGDTLGTLLKSILSIAGSSEVDRLLFECAKKAVIGEMNEKIDEEYFERAVNRPDYYPVMYYLLKENIGPFFAGAFSMFPALVSATNGKGRQ
jgi:hypothetical protein